MINRKPVCRQARSSIAVLGLVLVGATAGRTLLVLAADGGPVSYRFGARAPDPNCVPHPADPNALAWKIDTARIVGICLPPEIVPAGKFVKVFRPCDAQGDAFSVSLQQGPPGFGLAADDTAGTLTLSGELPRGEHYFYFRLVDEPGAVSDPCEVVYTLPVKGSPRKNTKPVLY